MKPSIMVVDDKVDLARGIGLVLADIAEDVRICHSGEDALQKLAEEPAHVLVSDVRMQGMSGLDLLRSLRDRWPDTRVILLTAFGTIESAVEAVQHGAFHYLTKPFDNDQLIALVQRAWEDVLDHQELVELRAAAEGSCDFHGIRSRDKHMAPVIEAIRRAAASDATVLVYGDSGTGKELVARALHAESDRAEQPFVAFNAAALSETLAEAELFGARKGAYTGSDRDRKGLFEEAEGGTLLIDEVSSMPLSLQSKLLRVIQEREVLPVGASTPVSVDVRIVAATNIDPRKLLAEGLLRKDLYYRLSVVRVALPPLSERPDDIPLLAELFLRRHAEASGRCRPLTMTSRVTRLLMSHDWPGNVRELQNVVERAAVMGNGEEIRPGDIEFEDDEVSWALRDEDVEAYEQSKRTVVERFQRRYLERLLASSGGNLSAAARKAHITRAALYKMVKRLGMDRREPGNSATP